MAVMVKMTMPIDVATYQGMHGDLLPVAKQAGLIFHSGREVEGGVAIVDFWPSAEAWQQFLDGPITQGLSSMGLDAPDDIEVIPVLTADG
jgi:hypothetical protein